MPELLQVLEASAWVPQSRHASGCSCTDASAIPMTEASKGTIAAVANAASTQQLDIPVPLMRQPLESSTMRLGKYLLVAGTLLVAAVALPYAHELGRRWLSGRRRIIRLHVWNVRPRGESPLHSVRREASERRADCFGGYDLRASRAVLAETARISRTSAPKLRFQAFNHAKRRKAALRLRGVLARRSVRRLHGQMEQRARLPFGPVRRGDRWRRCAGCRIRNRIFGRRGLDRCPV